MKGVRRRAAAVALEKIEAALTAAGLVVTGGVNVHVRGHPDRFVCARGCRRAARLLVTADAWVDPYGHVGRVRVTFAEDGADDVWADLAWTASPRDAGEGSVALEALALWLRYRLRWDDEAEARDDDDARREHPRRPDRMLRVLGGGEWPPVRDLRWIMEHGDLFTAPEPIEVNVQRGRHRTGPPPSRFTLDRS